MPMYVSFCFVTALLGYSVPRAKITYSRTLSHQYLKNKSIYKSLRGISLWKAETDLLSAAIKVLSLHHIAFNRHQTAFAVKPQLDSRLKTEDPMQNKYRPER